MNKEKTKMHVDDFIDDPDTDVYASWFLNLKRLPARLQFKFTHIISEYKLFCTYQCKQYRVTGCSRMGDIWLAKDHGQDAGYDLRVDISDCCDFKKTM